MPLPSFELARPSSVGEACLLLATATGGAEPLSGGTELLLALKQRTRTPARLVDLNDVPGLGELRFSPTDGLRIGARVTLADVWAHPDVARHYPAVAEAARAVGTLQLQSMGTVGGNLCQDTCCMYVNRELEQRDSLVPCHKVHGTLCHVVSGSELCWANYAGDLAPVLMTLDASVVVASQTGEEPRSIAALYTLDGKRPISLRPGEIVTRIDLPVPPPRSGATYLKLRQRDSLDYPLLGVAAGVVLAEDGTCAAARVALTGVDRGPILVEEAQALVGRPPTGRAVDELAKAAYKRARPVKNAWGYAVNYRVKMTMPYVRRAVAGAVARAQASGSEG